MLLCFLYVFQLNSRADENGPDPRIQSAIHNLDAEFDESFLWWAEVHDPESGFFTDPQHRDGYTSNTLQRATGMAANVLNILNRRGAGFDLEHRLKIVEKCTEILHSMRAPDGGGVTHLDYPSPESNGRLLAKDVVESNSNATGLAHKTRMLLIELLTSGPAPHPHTRSGDLLKGLSS